MRFCANASAAQHKIADNVKKRSISVKENNVSESFRCCSYGSYFKTIVIKYEEQPTVKGQESGLFRGNIQRWKKQKPELMPVLCENCRLHGFKNKMENWFHTSLINESLTF
jgi:hypothetical protein